ncbi:hypothetical protein CASFOL_036777 [Castilleja foliolosa]|uniref:Uncharacterized protein n=1 Tax=Castilleja foliolosa TaxID=1961234 RepID=A0ABD3BPJ6_9LAMI
MSSPGENELEEKFIEIENKCEKIINHLLKIKKVAKNREKMAEKLKAGPEKLVNDPNLEFPLFKGKKNGSSENRGTPAGNIAEQSTSKYACGLSKKGDIIDIPDDSDDDDVDISSWKCEEEAEPN